MNLSRKTAPRALNRGAGRLNGKSSTPKSSPTKRMIDMLISSQMFMFTSCTARINAGLPIKNASIFTTSRITRNTTRPSSFERIMPIIDLRLGMALCVDGRGL